MKRIILSIALVILLSSACARVYAQSGTLPIYGWAWSSTIGWMSFSSSNDNSAGGTYGVSLNSLTGEMTGYAWSSNIGWISFNERSGCPSNPCAPTFDMNRGSSSGWIRACGGTLSGQCTGGSRTDGWDGWIKLSGTRHLSPRPDGTGGVTYIKSTGPTVPTRIKGFAWGGQVVGWLEFNGTTDLGAVITDSVTVVCAESFVTGTTRPTWTVTATSVQPNPAFTYTWTWSRSGYKDTSAQYTYTSNNTMSEGETWTGPTVEVVNSTSGASRKITCPSVYNDDPNSSNINVYCFEEGIVQNDKPKWRAEATNVEGQADFTWTLPTSANYSIDSQNQYTVSLSAVNSVMTGSSLAPNATANGPRVRVRDVRSRTAEIGCSSITNDNTNVAAAAVELTLSDVSGRKKSDITVKQNQVAFAYTNTNKVVAAQCLATKAKTSGATSNPLWGLANVNFTDYDAPLNLGLASLNGYPLDTTVVGEFQLDVTCPELGNASNTETSSAILRVIVDPDLEEF